jgi:hypothetical protein
MYVALSLSDTGGRCYCITNNFLRNISTSDIVIIDETQRSNIEDIENIARRCSCVILFGDNKQAFLPKDLRLSPNKLKEELEKLSLGSISIREIGPSRRFDESVNKALRMLTAFSSDKEEIHLSNYRINLINDKAVFFDNYEKTSGNKKIFTNYDNYSLVTSTPNGKHYSVVPRSTFDFSISDFTDGIGHTLHAISFDVEHCFVYLPSLKLVPYKSKKQSFSFHSRVKITGSEAESVLNELNILFSRGTKSLTVFVDDIIAFSFLNLRCKNIVNR